LPDLRALLALCSLSFRKRHNASSEMRELESLLHAYLPYACTPSLAQSRCRIGVRGRVRGRGGVLLVCVGWGRALSCRIPSVLDPSQISFTLMHVLEPLPASAMKNCDLRARYRARYLAHSSVLYTAWLSRLRSTPWYILSRRQAPYAEWYRCNGYSPRRLLSQLKLR